MRKVKPLISFLLCLVLIVSTIYAYAETATKIGYVNAIDVNVRTGPGTEHSALGSLTHVNVEILGTANASDGALWYKIHYKDSSKDWTGYMIAKYITIVPPASTEPDPDFETQLATFPESYRESLKALHAVYPNWIFQANNVGMTLEEAVNLQYNTKFSKLVYMDQAVSWRSLHTHCYNWSTGTWSTTNGSKTGASWEIIAYYMDPRNFLNQTAVYMFMQQSYSASQTAETVRSIVAGTFLANGYGDNKDAYIEDIMEAAKQSNISPYVLAGTILTEQGTKGTSPLISGTYSGYEGYYNFFNVGASGDTSTDEIVNGLKYAKKNNWNSRRTAIIQGAQFYADGYINKGQDTYYYKDFNVLEDPDRLWHQYAQYIADAYNNGYKIKDSFATKYNDTLVFRIPVYEDMPATPYAKPAESDKLNNYFFTDLTVSGLSPAFAPATRSYSLTVSNNTTVYYTLPTGASYTGSKTFSLKKGSQVITLPVKSQTGYTHNYTITVTAVSAATLTVTPKEAPASSSSAPTTSTPATSTPATSTPVTSTPVTSTPASSKPVSSTPAVSYMRGDTNLDGKINGMDVAKIQKHIVKRELLSDAIIAKCDTNADGKINGMDLANVQKHIVGRISLTK